MNPVTVSRVIRICKGIDLSIKMIYRSPTMLNILQIPYQIPDLGDQDLDGDRLTEYGI